MERMHEFVVNVSDDLLMPILCLDYKIYPVQEWLLRAVFEFQLKHYSGFHE
jgi:hypothetical protein